MNETLKKELGYLFGAVVFGGMAFFFFYHATGMGSTEPAFGTVQARPETRAADAADVRREDAPPAFEEEAPRITSISLKKDTRTQIGEYVVTYRGKAEQGMFRLEVIVPDLDPDYVYVRFIDIETARMSGFYIGDRIFKPASVKGSRLLLVSE